METKKKALSYSQQIELDSIDAEINSLLLRLGQMGYTKEDIVDCLRKLYRISTPCPNNHTDQQPNKT